jgi:ABC-type Fe3+/spermidine/putrescine transport system ATPase subunit
MLRLENISKSFEKKKVLEDVSFEIKKGEFLSLLGPSGSGKTTLLRLIVGLDYPDKGKIFWEDKVISSAQYCLLPHKRNISMVFQDLALWPHMTAKEHLIFALSSLKLNKDELRQESERLTKMLSLTEFSERLPQQLSGGEKQRLALGRALATKPQILLLDEPLANLDLELKIQIQKELLRLHQESGISIVYVTHDQTEALLPAQTIALLHHGRLEQIGSPENLINSPKPGFAANFIKFSYEDIINLRQKLFR